MQPRYAVKWQSCEVCGREYAKSPHYTKRGAIRYEGECRCGGLDCHDDAIDLSRKHGESWFKFITHVVISGRVVNVTQDDHIYLEHGRDSDVESEIYETLDDMIGD